MTVLAIDGMRLKVGPIEAIDGTPVIDLKPYFATVDSIPDATVKRIGE